VLWAYNLILVPIVLLLTPLALLYALFSPRARRGLGDRLWPVPEMPPGSVWVHAASVGEAEAAAPLIEELLAREIPTLATTLTYSGRERLRTRLPGLRVRLAPLDLPGLISLSAARARAAVLVLIETEIWPNLIHAVAHRGARVVVVSGRISDASFTRYRWARPLLASVLRQISVVGAQSEEDRDRFVELGLPTERARVVGDLKLDRPDPPAPSAELRAALGPGPLLVGGSTHPGEEEALLQAWGSLRGGSASGLRLVLAPRHPERVHGVLRTAQRYGATAAFRSNGAAEAEVVVVDTIGELSAIYSLAELVFVGGTLAPIGGHNLLEPVRAGKLVVHGPHTENQRSQERLLRPLGVLCRVEHARDLSETLGRLWADPDRNAVSASAGAELELHRGALARSLDLVLGARTRSA
jgi:3-deoxy-D-manno-octulosonic-acid transferase